jgi:hypothetical protein
MKTTMKIADKVPAGYPKKAKQLEEKNLYPGVPWCLRALVAKVFSFNFINYATT